MPPIQYLSQAAAVSMADEWFDIANEDHFWMQWRFHELMKAITDLDINPILEIGCGNGIAMSQFEKKNYHIDGCDLNELALKKVKDVKGNLFVYNIFDQHEKLDNVYKSILLLDVIEHIKDDKEFINTATRVLQAEAYVIINVPAHQFLFSKYDLAAGHERRYNKQDLEKTIAASGLVLLTTKYWGWTMMPIALMRKLILKFTPMEKVIQKGFAPSKIADKILRLLMKLETGLNVSAPFGTSLIAVCKYTKPL